MTFKFYDSTSHKIFEKVLPDIEFEPDLEIGNIESPVIFTVQEPRHLPDANNDGKVNVIDAIDVLQYITDIY
ncbi:MAG: hypothetical protein OMM_07080 [Candidatus Magnetoglobus multicellularis str. Araruama]|uniref:Dockerin domain-containing protein n=1 Tax=Candidatus Magnetoglobus multicellularis str. Araruama TaxID=890399 RepID=A0A1V1PEL8_9BACT|nr:MAG: hypothetical protein OMM_07080 [Candidatus Magnetoglobus multicellularis str. Araruama]